jgi:predicted RNA binding protein YcfA (HicA-like mRNA interferase family)
MSKKLPQLSGIQVLKILCNQFDFKLINSKGSHRTLINTNTRPPILIEIVVHSQLRTGTLQGIIRKSMVGREAFLKALDT